MVLAGVTPNIIPIPVETIKEETIETEEMQSEYYSSFGMDTNGYTEKFHELADAYRKCMDKITFTEEDGRNRQNKF